VKPDVIQGWMVHGNLAALFAVNFIRGHVPVLWNIRQSLYSFNYEKPVTALAIKLGARLSHKPALILYNSRTSAAQHNTLGYKIDKTLVIPNGFDTDKFSPSDVARRSLRSELGVTENTLLIALIARYHPMKDHSNFLYAASLLLKKYPGVRFVLSGEQINWSNRPLRESIQQLGLVKQVHLLDVRQDMPRIMAAVDIAALSSYDEGFPNVIGEAMSCGVPCVATHLSDLPAVIGKTGRLVPPRDSQALSSALESLIEIGHTGRQRLGRDARARIVEHFRLDPVVAQYEALYEKVTARQKEFIETSTDERRHVYWQQDDSEDKRL
jgi:glycosyltransferase involved in cell wall biosynthesis